MCGCGAVGGQVALEQARQARLVQLALRVLELLEDLRLQPKLEPLCVISRARQQEAHLLTLEAGHRRLAIPCKPKHALHIHGVHELGAEGHGGEWKKRGSTDVLSRAGGFFA